jgi:hypothetical protein
VNWPTFWTTLAQITLPAVLALLGSYLAIRSQLKLKSMEIESQSSIKAKELIFSAYQKRWEKAEKDAAELNERSHEIFDKHIRRDFDGMAVIFSKILSKQVLGLYQEDFDNLIVELTNAGIAEKHKKKIDFVKSQFAVDIKSVVSK